MNAAELVKLIRRLHQSDQQTERQNFYQELHPYRLESEYDWQEHMNDPAEEGIIQSGVYLVWAQDQADGIHFWDTSGSRYLLPYCFPDENQPQDKFPEGL